MVTTDGGTTWSRQSVGAAALGSVACASTTVCSAVGGAFSTTPPGAIFNTTNGTSWVGQTIPSGVQQVIGVSCVTATPTCMATGLNSDLGGIILSNTTPPTPPNHCARPCERGDAVGTTPP